LIFNKNIVDIKIIPEGKAINMLRSKKIIIVSHCILNQNSVVNPLARAKGTFKFVKHLIDEGNGFIQLPCPELRYLGITREPMNKSEYDNLDYRKLCKSLLLPIIDEISMYIKNDYLISGIIGINESPTCSITGNKGIFMEEFFIELDKRNIKLKCIEVPANYNDEEDYDYIISKHDKIQS